MKHLSFLFILLQTIHSQTTVSTKTTILSSSTTAPSSTTTTTTSTTSLITLSTTLSSESITLSTTSTSSASTSSTVFFPTDTAVLQSKKSSDQSAEIQSMVLGVGLFVGIGIVLTISAALLLRFKRAKEDHILDFAPSQPPRYLNRVEVGKFSPQPETTVFYSNSIPVNSKSPIDTSYPTPIKPRSPNDYGNPTPIKPRSPNDYGNPTPINPRSPNNYSYPIPIKPRSPNDYSNPIPVISKSPIDSSDSKYSSSRAYFENRLPSPGTRPVYQDGARNMHTTTMASPPLYSNQKRLLPNIPMIVTNNLAMNQSLQLPDVVKMVNSHHQLNPDHGKNMLNNDDTLNSTDEVLAPLNLSITNSEILTSEPEEIEKNESSNVNSRPGMDRARKKFQHPDIESLQRNHEPSRGPSIISDPSTNPSTIRKDIIKIKPMHSLNLEDIVEYPDFYTQSRKNSTIDGSTHKDQS